MTNIKLLTNSHFTVLSYLYDERTKGDKVLLTQQEIADETDICRATINKIIKELKEAEFLRQDGNHLSRCVVTPKAIKVVETFRDLEQM